MGRVPCCDKANVKKGPWSPDEDAKLKAYIEKHGTGGNWIALPHKIGMKRCGKSCRLRWLNYLRPNIKHGDFSEEEDQIICNLYISIGSRWSLIAAQLPGRTDNDIKNYWNTKLKKKLLGSCRKGSSSSCPGSSPNQEPNSPHAQPLSSSALERIQLHFQLQGLRSPFSFYSHPLLWPKLHHLRDDIFQNQPSEAFAMTPVQQASTSIVVEPSNEPVVQMEAMIPDSMSRDIQGELDGSDLYGSSSLSNNSNQDSMAKGLQDEIRDLLQGNDLDCFKELDGEKESMSWWDGNDFEDKSSFNSWDSASTLQTNLMFEEYVMEYGL